MTGTIAGFTSTGIDDNATSTAITIDASENVGIGTTTPVLPLTVVADTNADSISIQGRASDSISSIQFTKTDGLTNTAGDFKLQCRPAAATPYLQIQARNPSNVAVGILEAKATGDVTIQTGNLVIGTSGKGIDFSATSDGSGNMTSEVLDDYETGTFTLTTEGDATGTLGATKIGTYTKIGNIVHVALSFQVTANFTDVTIGGLPYASNFGGLFSSALPTSGVQTSLDVNITGKLTRNATTIDFYNNTGLTSGHAPNTTNQYYRLSATYRTDS
jgi:hypothetical protein